MISVIIIELLHQEVGSSAPINHMISVIIIELWRQEVGSDDVVLSLLNFYVKKWDQMM